MFNTIRIRLTILYLLASLVLVTLVGAGAFRLLQYYFYTTTDLALQHRMAHELMYLNAHIPSELIAADQEWNSNRSRLVPTVPDQHVVPQENESTETDGREYGASDMDKPEEIEAEQTFDGELAAIFVLPIGEDGQLLPGGTNTPMPPDATAEATALEHGSDIRTVLLPSGASVRLLSYRVERTGNLRVLQLGRTLIDQDRVLRALLLGLLGLGGVSTVIFGGASYWLAGRSLRPAQDAWQRQQSFVANASHEIRAPLTLLRATADVARRTSRDVSQQELLDDILHECDHMAQLVDDLLRLSRLDSQTLPVQREDIALIPFVDAIVQQVERTASPKQIRVSNMMTSGRVCADPLQLRQIFLIVIDNALRFTPAGGTIHITNDIQRHQVFISIADTGSGIAPEHLPHVFERFYRANSEHTDQYGAGIGLSLAQALTQAQGGTIRIASTSNVGTTVTFTLPRSS